MATKIILDAGHGGTDPGAVYEGRQEKDDVLALTLALGEALKELGYDVEYTRTTDTYDSPVQKARIGNASGADYFISLHRNSSPTPNQYNGVQTLVYNDAGVKGELGRNINSELEKVGFRNINVAERPDLAVLRRTAMPAVLLEVGFINSEKDNALFDEKFDDIVEGIARGIDETLSPSAFSAASGVNGNMEEDYDIEDKQKKPCRKHGYQILCGVYRGYNSAAYHMNCLVNEGYEADVYEDDGLFQVRIGSFEELDDAEDLQKKLRERGYCTLVVKAY